jgi:hypothetical protein
MLARRARTESARLVSTTGTRAPDTRPAMSALARKKMVGYNIQRQK